MNRFKKYVRSKGYKLECDYPYIPFDIGSQSIEGVYVNSEYAYITIYCSSITSLVKFNCDGTITRDFD